VLTTWRNFTTLFYPGWLMILRQSEKSLVDHDSQTHGVTPNAAEY